VNCIFEKDITVSQNMIVNEIIELNTNENSNYAFLCNLISGNISCSSISIESQAIKEEQSNYFLKVKSEGVSVV